MLTLNKINREAIMIDTIINFAINGVGLILAIPLILALLWAIFIVFCIIVAIIKGTSVIVYRLFSA